jgi:tetratricopeptide (TPR) repeat protein
MARAQVFLLLGDSGRAISECQQMPAIYRRSEDLARLGAIYAQAGRIVDAQNLLSRLGNLPASPRKNYYVAVLEGEIDLAAGNASSAISRLGSIADNQAGGAHLLEPLARALLQAGKLEAAAKEYQAICEQKAEMLFPPSGSWFMGTWSNALFETGRCLDKLGRDADARQYFRSYLWVLDGADPDLPKIQQAREQLKKRSSRTGSP